MRSYAAGFMQHHQPISAVARADIQLKAKQQNVCREPSQTDIKGFSRKPMSAETCMRDAVDCADILHICLSVNSGGFYSQEVAAAAAKSSEAGYETHCWISCGSGLTFCSSHGNCPKAFRDKRQEHAEERDRMNTRVQNYKGIHCLIQKIT